MSISKTDIQAVSECGSLNEAATVRYIPNKTFQRLNKIALKHGKNCMTDDCPVLRDGHAAPIFFAVSNIDTTGWVRCMRPATPDCTVHVFLDIQLDQFNKLPIKSVEP